VPASDKASILALKPLIIRVIETGQVNAYLNKYTSQGGLVTQVEGAAYGAFGDGLHAAFYLSAGLVIVAGLLAAVTLGRTPAAAAVEEKPAGSLH
jgi:K+-transporting ATPase A subunit